MFKEVGLEGWNTGGAQLFGLWRGGTLSTISVQQATVSNGISNEELRPQEFELEFGGILTYIHTIYSHSVGSNINSSNTRARLEWSFRSSDVHAAWI